MKQLTYLAIILGLFFLLSKRTYAQEPDQISLARLIFSEAANESSLGKAAVGWVVRNRVESERFPNTYPGVIFQPWQFSGVNSALWEKTYQVKNMSFFENAIWQDCLEIADKVIKGTIMDPTSRADHYYNPRLVSPYWAKKMTVTRTIGNHLFLKS